MVPPPRISRLAAVAILAAALGVRLAACLWWDQRLGPDTRFAFGDSESYWILAERIANGESYAYGPGQSRAFRAPGYPLLLAPLFVFHSDPPVLAARALGALLGTCAVGGVMWLAQQRFPPRTALWAGLLTAGYPGAIGMSVLVLSEAPFCPLMVAQLICWTEAMVEGNSRSRATAWAAAAGLMAGLATLVRPSWLLFSLLAAIAGLVFCTARRRQLLVSLAVLSGLVVVMAPWWVRNYRIYHRFVPTTLQFGASLYDGLNPQATGASDMSFVLRFEAEQRREDAEHTGALAGTFDERLDRRMRHAALAWARQHPWRTAQLMGIKLARMWSPWPTAPEMSGGLAVLVLCSYPPLIVLALWGLVQQAPRGWSTLLCLMPAVYFSGLHMIFVGSIRYRQPAMLPLIAFAAVSLAALTAKRSPAKRGSGPRVEC